MLYLSIDFGTSAVKVSILDEKFDTCCWAKKSYDHIIMPGEKIEIDPVVLFDALIDAVKRLDQDLLKQVSVLCYDTFSPSLVFLTNDGKFVYPNIITHLDRRSRKESSQIDDMIGRDDYMKIAGIYPFAGGCSAMTLLWFQNNLPEVLERSERIGHLTTWVHWMFTGNWMVDLVNASMMGIYETTTQGTWSQTLLDAFHLNRQWFPDIYAPGTIYGTLLPEVAEKLGLTPGIPVAVGTNDVAAAQMGADNHTPGDIMNTAGSSEMVSILTDRPVVNPHYYLRNAAIPGLWQIYSTTAGGFAVEWFYTQFCKDLSESYYYSDYIANALMDYSNSNKKVTFDPYLTGDRQSLDIKTGSWHGLTLEATREAMLASMICAMNEVLRTTLDEAKEVLPLSDTIKISGGMVNPTYIKVKELEIPGFSFEIVDDCPIKGNAKLVEYHQAGK